MFPKNERIAPVFSAALYSTTLSFPSFAFSLICFWISLSDAGTNDSKFFSPSVKTPFTL
jgi:hypothetical protein